MAAAQREARTVSGSGRSALDVSCRSTRADACKSASAARCTGREAERPMMIALLALLVAQTGAPPMGWSGGPVPTAARAWPTHEQDVVLKDFRFRDGESLPELKVHVTTLGSPHRDAAGRIDNAVMVLHGTGGTGQQFLQPQFADELYRPG